jgi:AcrR family transcriptional regulator
MSATSTKRRRLTQQERSATTRAALLDSTIDCLIELGYERSTTLEISERALLSRGAHQHHFETRAKLFAAAVERLANRSYEELERQLGSMPRGPDYARELLDVTWRTFNGPLYQVVVDLSIQARTDPELRASLEPLEHVMSQKAMPLLRSAFSGIVDEAEIASLVVMALATIRGLVLLRVLQPGYDIERAWEDSCRPRLLAMIEAAAPRTRQS